MGAVHYHDLEWCRNTGLIAELILAIPVYHHVVRFYICVPNIYRMIVTSLIMIALDFAGDSTWFLEPSHDSELWQSPHHNNM